MSNERKSTNQKYIDMQKNLKHSSRCMEDILAIIFSDLNRIHVRMNWLQSQIDSRKDLAIERLRLTTGFLKESAKKELKSVRERYGTGCF